jgi:hypothetical protein
MLTAKLVFEGLLTELFVEVCIETVDCFDCQKHEFHFLLLYFFCC